MKKLDSVAATSDGIVPTIWTKLAYGFGSVAYGVKDNGFNYFLLIFYSQAMGVDAPLVGLALLIALLVDAFSDPLIGYMSDNTRTRWGRRHPWMYGAIIPVTVLYFLIWNPPGGLTGNELFPWIVGISILIRLSITLYEIPCTSLVAELTDDYDQRTSLMSYRYFFGWFGGTLIAAITLLFFLVPTETFTSGLMNKDGYGKYGFLASGMIFISMLVASLGTHHHIPNLKAPPPVHKKTLGGIFKEIFETIGDPSLAALFLATLFSAIATGLSAGLYYYMMGYFWGFSSEQIFVLSMSIIISAFVALFLAPLVSAKLGKKKGAIIMGILAFTIAPTPVVLRLLGVMPDNGDPALFPIMLVWAIVDVSLIIVTQILTASMIADLAEQTQLRTARRSEGVLFAAVTFSRKAMQGFGVLAATIVLTIANFPKDTPPEDVSADALFRLGAIYAPTLFALWMIAVLCLKFYKISRADHVENLRKLAETG
jgi:Na+/melibiose symporter-like transporter